MSVASKANTRSRSLSRWTSLLFLTALGALLLSTPGGGQIGPCATVLGPNLPDLIVDQDLLRAQAYLTQETFSASGCTVVEGCVSSPGTHLLLRFMSSTPNIGQADLVIGDPTLCLGSLFRFSECHQHLHFQEYADYRLWTVAGYQNWVANRDLSRPTNRGRNAALLDQARDRGELLVGRKQGFCIIDIAPFAFDGVTPPPPRFRSCNDQGLQVAYADQYVPQLACQFVQMTDVAEGFYVLEDHVNPEQLLPESDYTNNSSAVQFFFKPKRGRSGPVIEVSLNDPGEPVGKVKTVVLASRPAAYRELFGVCERSAAPALR